MWKLPETNRKVREVLTEAEVEETALLALQGGQLATARWLEDGMFQMDALVHPHLVQLAYGWRAHHAQVGAVLQDERDAQGVADGKGRLLFQRVVEGRRCSLRERLCGIAKEDYMLLKMQIVGWEQLVNEAST